MKINKIFRNWYFSLLFILTCYSVSYSQNEIQGILIDSNTKENISSIYVKLLDNDTNKLVHYTESQSNGLFIFKNISSGTYQLRIESVYYQEYSNIFKLQSDLDVKEIYLIPIETLDEVQIIGRKKMLSFTATGNKLQVEGSKLEEQDNAMEVLKFAPTVNTQGGLSVLGSSNVVVKINNKELKLPYNSLLAFLNGLEADNIKSIEIIDKKTASMDADTEAIINIILKKDIGTSIDLSGYFVSTKEKLQGGRGSIYIFHRKNKYRLLANLYFNKFDHTKFLNESIDFSNTPTHYDIQQDYSNTRKETYIDVGFDYLKDSLTTYSFLYDYGVDDEDNISVVEHNRITTNIINDSIINSISKKASLQNYHTFSLFYEKIKDPSGSALSFSTSYSINQEYYPLSQNNNYLRDNTLLLNETISQEQNIKHQIASIESNFIKEKKGNTYKLGIKLTGIDYQNAEINLISNENSIFTFQQEVGALYGSYSINKENYTLYFGLRNELTYNKFNFDEQITSNYNNVLPSITYKRVFNKNNISYLFTNFQMERPSFYYYNPISTVLSPTRIYHGNPNIKAYVSKNIGTQYIYKQKYVANLTYSFSNNYIYNKPDFNSITSITTVSPHNDGKTQKLALYISIPIIITKWWSIQNKLYGGFTNNIINNTLYSGNFASFNQSNSYELPKNITFDFDWTYNLPLDKGYYTTKNKFLSNLNVSIPLFKEKAKLRFSIDDIFNTDKTEYSSNFNSIIKKHFSKWDNQRFGVSFSYTFQSGKEKDVETKESIIEDEKYRMGRDNE